MTTTCGARLGIGLLSAVVCAGAACRTSAAKPANMVKRDEMALRKSVTASVQPVCPTDAKTSGVAVVSVIVTPEGRVRSVGILEAPDRKVARAISEAVRQWRFRPVSVEGSFTFVEVHSKLTFYLDASDGACVVLDPEQKMQRQRAAAEAQRRTRS
jgi:TonB family protein